MSRSRRLSAAVAVLAAVALPAWFQATPGAAAPPPRVSVISDSILTSVTWSTDGSLASLSDGLDLQIDAGVCRRLNGQSCEFNGTYVPTTLSVINSWITLLGPVVVIVEGYNDIPDQFAGDVELTLNTLRDHGVQHVLWVNLHDISPEYTAKNAVLAAAARHHPELRVLDWNSYAAPHPEWFQTDWIHLRPAGGDAIAAWLHQAIADTFAPPPPTPPLPPATPVTPLIVPAQRMVARVGVRFDHRLRAGGGVAPLRWRTTNASLHRARLHLLASGELTGRPRRASTFSVPLQVTDANGTLANVTVVFAVKSPRRARSVSP